MNSPLNLIDPSGHCDLAAGVNPDDIHSQAARDANMGFQPGCWGIYYPLYDQGIGGLDWRWSYAYGPLLEEWASANYAMGNTSVLGIAGGLSYMGNDIVGYQLLMSPLKKGQGFN